MGNELYNAIGKIHASEALKAKTERYVLEEINKRNQAKAHSHFRFAAVFSAIFLLIIFSGVSYHLYFIPAAYVDMDVNPSVGLTLNRFDRVIGVHAYNEDGAVVLSGADVRFRSYKDPAGILLDAIIANGFLLEDGLVSLTVQSRSGADDILLAQLEQVVSAILLNHHANAHTDIFSVSSEVRTNAHEHHVSPAMYIAISELQEVDPTATFESCAGHSITQVRARTRAHHGGSHQNDGDELQNADDELFRTENPSEDVNDTNGHHGRQSGGHHGGNGNGRHR